MTRPTLVVTIDGPAASGKSSVSRAIAKQFGWLWVSTGAFYRGLALIAQKEGADLTNEDALVRLAGNPVWSVQLTPEQTLVLWRGQDVTSEINREDVGSLASQVSQFPKVRAALLNAQRQCAKERPGLVAEGRDCGTVVFPQAQVKIYLTARAEDRAQRRATEQGADVAHISSQQQVRDSQDAARKAAPMQAAADAHIIDTSSLTLAEVVARVAGLVTVSLDKHAP